MMNIIGNQITNYRKKVFKDNEFFFDYLKSEIKEKEKWDILQFSNNN